MNSSPSDVKGWSQQTLYGPEAVGIQVTCQWERSTGCKRVGLAVTNLDDYTTMAMWSKPLPMSLTPNELGIVIAGLLAESLMEHCHPF